MAARPRVRETAAPHLLLSAGRSVKKGPRTVGLAARAERSWRDPQAADVAAEALLLRSANRAVGLNGTALARGAAILAYWKGPESRPEEVQLETSPKVPAEQAPFGRGSECRF